MQVLENPCAALWQKIRLKLRNKLENCAKNIQNSGGPGRDINLKVKHVKKFHPSTSTFNTAPTVLSIPILCNEPIHPTLLSVGGVFTPCYTLFTDGHRQWHRCNIFEVSNFILQKRIMHRCMAWRLQSIVFDVFVCFCVLVCFCSVIKTVD